VISLYDGLELYRLDPEDGEWRDASPPRDMGLTGQAAAGAWDGHRLVVVTYAPEAVAFDPTTSSWSALGLPPIGAAEDYPTVEVTSEGDVVAGYWSHYAVLPAGANEWEALPERDVRLPVVTGDVLVGAGPPHLAGEERVPEPAMGEIAALGL
jgi:hypothetical protein